MTNLQIITQAYLSRQLLILWADTPFPLPVTSPANPAQSLSAWQQNTAHLPPPDISLWQLPPLPILSFDPTARLETAFAAADASLRVVVTRADVPSTDRHTLLKLAGDLPSRRAVIQSRQELRRLAENADKRHLLTEARRFSANGGVLLVCRTAPPDDTFRAWWSVVHPALGAAQNFSLGTAIGGIPALNVDFGSLSAALWKVYRQQSQEEPAMNDTAPPAEGSSGTVYNIHIDHATGLAIGNGAKITQSPERARNQSLLSELQDIANEWKSLGFLHYFTEDLNEAQKSFVRHPQGNFVLDDKTLKMFLMIAALQQGGNWCYWFNINEPTQQVVNLLLRTLTISYQRVQYRTFYLLQFVDLSKSEVVIELSPTTIEIVNKFVLTKRVKKYLIDLTDSSNTDDRRKASAVLREIERYCQKVGSK